jgi:hypothetical protein
MSISKVGSDGMATALTLASGANRLVRASTEVPTKVQIQADLLGLEGRQAKLQTRVASLEVEALGMGVMHAKGDLTRSGKARLIAMYGELGGSKAALVNIKENTETLKLLSKVPESKLAGKIYHNNQRIATLEVKIGSSSRRLANLRYMDWTGTIGRGGQSQMRRLEVAQARYSTELSQLTPKQKSLIERLKAEPQPKLSRADYLGGSMSLMAAGLHGYAAATRLANGDTTSGLLQATASVGNAAFAVSALSGRVATMGKAGLIVGTGAAVTGMIVDGMS